MRIRLIQDEMARILCSSPQFMLRKISAGAVALRWLFDRAFAGRFGVAPGHCRGQ
jgi:hypothetical protein